MTPEFDRWWDADELTQANPYAAGTPIWWAWEGWRAAQRAMKLAPLCPACESPQVQLTDWSVEPTEWRCRVCRHDFVVEAKGD